MHFFVDILIAFLSGLLVPIGTNHQYVILTQHLRAGQKGRRQLKNRRATFYRRRIRIPRNVKRQKCVIHLRSEVSRPRRVNTLSRTQSADFTRFTAYQIIPSQP